MSSQPVTDTHAEADVHLDWTPGVPTPDNPLRWGDRFTTAAAKTLRNTQMRANLAKATTTIRNKRGMRVDETPDWEQLRQDASRIKNYTMAHLPELLEQLERNVVKRGGIVHWARNANEACQIVHKLITDKGVDEVVKIKSMATQEINLNKYLEERGIAAWETDLAEMIVQLSEDMPSHIVVPAIHRNRAEVQAIFKARMGDAPAGLGTEPRELTMAARAHLRKKFLSAKVAVSGSNMMIAETGTCSVFESEGNGRMCLTLPETLISVVGIEKLVPTFRDAEVFAQLLPRSATGERMNPYTSLWTGVTEGDGPQEFHLILLDNGRSTVLGNETGRQALHCIRCGACMNACPVYEHTGGHAYGSVYPGPIGSVLTPQLLNTCDHHDPATTLPYACTLCNACFEACPVAINLPELLVDQRHKITEASRHGIPGVWDIAMGVASRVMDTGDHFAAATKPLPLARLLAGSDKRLRKLPWPGSLWTGHHDIPAPPQRTFRAWWADNEEEDAR
ncbi:MAG: LutB/LldF family L-lactate oxidation iron-sulfur protein [Actinomycetaceae bacterium]|nr:LutB/LldF family L-lactate oxidation iron-sulfur protein [Actinomycetaceae bacterium]